MRCNVIPAINHNCMTERIKNLTVEGEKVRAGDVRVDDSLFEELAEMNLQTDRIRSVALHVLAANGEQEEVATGRFLACRKGSDSRPSPVNELDTRKKTIAAGLTKIILTKYRQTPPEEHQQKEYSGDPFMIIRPEDLKRIGFGIYDEHFDVQMSHDQRKKGRGRASFMKDVFLLICENFTEALGKESSDGQATPYKLRLNADKNDMTVYLQKLQSPQLLGG